jgi:hypothetical protein
MDKLSFAERLIELGFKHNIDVNIKDGWNGATIYHPIVRLFKDDITVVFSLERHNVREMIYSVERGIETSVVNEKLIKITKACEVVYENNYGISPDDEVLNSILN